VSELEALEAGAPRRWTILVVDDEPANRELLEAILAPDGFEIVLAEDGEQALAIVAARKVDLVVLDVLMPGIDGIETCRRIRNQLGKRHLPIVFATALHDRDARIRGKAAGADDFLTKPIDELELRVRVKNLLTVSAYHELRERQRVVLEEKLERMRSQILRVDHLIMLGTLAAGIGHELGNIAAIYEATLDLVVERAAAGLPPDPADLATFARVASHLRAHVRQLGRVGRPGAEFTAPADLRDIVQTTVHMMRVAGKTKAIDVTTELPAAPVMVSVNPMRIEQVLVNLIANAADALEGTTGRAASIRVALATDRVPDRVDCLVEDSGCGIPPSDLESIFKAYFTTKAPGRGTGLGLPVVKTIVESYGGKLRVSSREGRGSTFAFDLPAATTAV
jgi:signal transduction histidine kinase